MSEGNKNRKYGRNLNGAQNKRYKAENRHARNKEVRRQRTLCKQPNNRQIALEKPEDRLKFDRQHQHKNHEKAANNLKQWLSTAKEKKAPPGQIIDRFPSKIDPLQLLRVLMTKEKSDENTGTDASSGKH
jgi:hypothetical protein